MSEKHYQISPIELVQWAEPLFGFGVGRATGFSEKTIASYEAAAGIRLPAALREYYRTCGKASLNEMLHPILIPDKDGKPFGGRLSFSQDGICQGDFRPKDESSLPANWKLSNLPRPA